MNYQEYIEMCNKEESDGWIEVGSTGPEIEPGMEVECIDIVEDDE